MRPLPALRPSAVLLVRGRKFSGRVRWTNVMQIVKGIAPCEGQSRLLEVDLELSLQGDLGSERARTMRKGRGVLPFDYSLTTIGHLTPTPLDAEWFGQRDQPWRAHSVSLEVATSVVGVRGSRHQ
jgi:hypothetical protein